MLTTILKQSKFKQSLDDIPLNCVHKSNWLRYVFQERSAFFYIEEGSYIIQIYIYQTKQKLLKGGGRIVLMV